MIYDDIFTIILLIETISDAIKYLSPNTMQCFIDVVLSISVLRVFLMIIFIVL